MIHKHLFIHLIAVVSYNKHSGPDDIPENIMNKDPLAYSLVFSSDKSKQTNKQTKTCLVVMTATERHKEMEIDKKCQIGWSVVL